MKKFLKGIVLVVIAVGLLYWGYKYFNKSTAVLDKIHVDADSVIKIGLHDIKATLVWDAITSPGYYYDNVSFSKREKPKDSLGDKGIDLQPYSLTLFTVPSVQNTVFTTLAIDNSADFEAYIASELDKKNLSFKVASDKGYRYALAKKEKAILAWNTHKLVVALQLEPSFEKTKQIVEDILVNDKLIQEKDHPLVAALTTGSNHITYVRQEGEVHINFEDGKALVMGNMITDEPETYQPQVALETMLGASFLLHFDANFEHQKHKDNFIKMMSGMSFFEKNNLDIQALADRTNGYLSIAIKGKTSQTDTIVTYTYDDNFEKIAQKSTQEKEVPKIHIDLGAEEESLKAYLTAQEAVNGDSVLTAFPYYNFYVKEGALNTSFGTFKGRPKLQKQVSNNFLACSINFPALQEDLNLSQTKRLFGLLEQFQLKAKQKQGKEVILNGSLSGLNKDVNIVTQLFFGLKESSKDSLPDTP